MEKATLGEGPAGCSFRRELGRCNRLPLGIRSHEISVRRGVQDVVARHFCTYTRKEIVMKAIAVRLLTVLTLAIAASLVLLPPVAQAGITARGAD